MTDLNLDKVNGRPVILLSSPRTGSTVLSKDIASELKYKLFNEVSLDTKALHDFFRYDLINKNYVLKEHGLLYKKHYPESFIMQDAYVIRLRRRNVLEQIMSSYIAINRKTFFYSITDEVDEMIVLDEERLLDTMEFILRYNRECNSYSHKIDCDVYYEDFNFDNKHGTVSTPKPKNNDEFIEWVNKILKDRL